MERAWVGTQMVPDNDQSSLYSFRVSSAPLAVANAIVFKVSWKAKSVGKKRAIVKATDIYYYDDNVNVYRAMSGERETTKIHDEWIQENLISLP